MNWPYQTTPFVTMATAAEAEDGEDDDRRCQDWYRYGEIEVARRRHPADAQFIRSLGLGYKLCAVIPVAGQRTHGTTFRSLKVVSQVATPGAESEVYDISIPRPVM